MDGAYRKEKLNPKKDLKNRRVENKSYSTVMAHLETNIWPRKFYSCSFCRFSHIENLLEQWSKINLKGGNAQYERHLHPLVGSIDIFFRVNNEKNKTNGFFLINLRGENVKYCKNLSKPEA